MRVMLHKFAKWLEKKAHEMRVKRIFKKYGSYEFGGKWSLMTEEQQRKSFLTAFVETGDTRCLIDYFQLRKPGDYRYFEKAFREALATSVFRQYDSVRNMLVSFWYEILCLENQKEYQEAMLKKYFGKNRQG